MRWLLSIPLTEVKNYISMIAFFGVKIQMNIQQLSVRVTNWLKWYFTQLSREIFDGLKWGFTSLKINWKEYVLTIFSLFLLFWPILLYFFKKFILKNACEHGLFLIVSIFVWLICVALMLHFSNIYQNPRTLLIKKSLVFLGVLGLLTLSVRLAFLI